MSDSKPRSGGTCLQALLLISWNFFMRFQQGWVRSWAVALVSALWLGGCAQQSVPLTPVERETRVQSDYAALFAGQGGIATAVTLETAMARAIRHHLATRVKSMDVALAQGLTAVASYRQLPGLTVVAGYEERDRVPTDSLNLYDTTRALSVAWNVLDFGVSYLHTRQQSDRVLIASELRRKAAHNLLQEVQTVYWRAWAAQRLESMMDPLMARVRKALVNAQEAERQRLQPPMQLLDYQKTLLKTWQQIQEMWKGLSGARVALAELMNVNPGESFVLAAPERVVLPDLERFPPLVRLERLALRQRPELRERDYQARIQTLETRKELLRLLPGLEFRTGRNFNSGDAYVNHVWAESGMKLVWNVLHLLSAPSQIALSRTQEEYQALMRRALSMSVLAQVHVGYRRLVQALEEYVTAQALSDVNERLYQHARAGKEAASMNELDLIHREAERITSLTRRDVAYAELRNGVGAFFVTLGSDVLPEALEPPSVAELEQTIAARLAAWERGEIQELTGGDDGGGVSGVFVPEWKIETVPAHDRQEVFQPEWTIESADTTKSGDDGIAHPEWVIETSDSN
ncbi:MAG: TolC family protein [Magnetococcales bacterium]|nr:TolC family protein [Magnetococcales bacterium]